MTAAEKGGQIEGMLGDTGGRIFNGVSSSIAQFGSAAVAGPAAVYSLIAGEAFDSGLADAEQRGFSGGKAVVYAGAKAASETALTLLMGKVGKKLGLESFEESLSPAMRSAAEKLAAKAVPQSLLSKFAAAAGGAGMESLEESLVDVVNQGIELQAGARSSLDWKQTLEAAATGAAARGATGAGNAVKELSGALRKIPRENIEQTMLGVQAAEIASKPPAEGAGLPPLVEQARQFWSTATDEQKAAAATFKNAKEFEGLTGIKGTTQTFRESFRSTLELAESTGDSTELINPPADAPAGEVAPPDGATAPDAAPAAIPTDPNTGQPSTDPTQQPVAAEPTLPPQDTVPQPPSTEPVVTSARKAMMAVDRETFGLTALDDPATRRWANVLETAVDNGTPGRALDLANEVLAEPRAFSDVETAGLVVRAAELKNQFEALDSSLSTVPAGADYTELAARSAELNRLEMEFDAISRALRLV